MMPRVMTGGRPMTDQAPSIARPSVSVWSDHPISKFGQKRFHTYPHCTGFVFIAKDASGFSEAFPDGGAPPDESVCSGKVLWNRR